MKQAISFLLLFISATVSAADLHEDFLALKDSGRNFEVVGTVCEEVARLEFERESYPAKDFEVITGVAYGDGRRTIGELDVVVFDHRKDRAVHVSEVKCWKDLRAGLEKARNQRERFIRAVQSGRRLEFYRTLDHSFVDPRQFERVDIFTTIAQRGSMTSGYEDELEHSLEDLMKLRQMIIQCQRRGECARPRLLEQ